LVEVGPDNEMHGFGTSFSAWLRTVNVAGTTP